MYGILALRKTRKRLDPHDFATAQPTPHHACQMPSLCHLSIRGVPQPFTATPRYVENTKEQHDAESSEIALPQHALQILELFRRECLKNS